ncbi:hypothetical protein Agub_g11065 [Astrephomene gubernaculifera]|uniref:Uncharacterized protein n=1 Tax=Astrephomene gubernaculifera TaxID=47775 RepID=A0AAD3HQC0_9CHLO|nr:hypothetical protein Agub_g11065 [Astrephomene gubernaculifera]
MLPTRTPCTCWRVNNASASCKVTRATPLASSRPLWSWPSGERATGDTTRSGWIRDSVVASATYDGDAPRIGQFRRFRSGQQRDVQYQDGSELSAARPTAVSGRDGQPTPIRSSSNPAGGVGSNNSSNRPQPQPAPRARQQSPPSPPPPPPPPPAAGQQQPPPSRLGQPPLQRPQQQQQYQQPPQQHSYQQPFQQPFQQRYPAAQQPQQQSQQQAQQQQQQFQPQPHRQQQQQQQQQRQQQRQWQRPFSPSYWRSTPERWFARPDYTPAALYEEIVQRCERNTCDVDALHMICRLATSPQEARVALNAFAAVRASRVRRGRPDPFDEHLAAAFARMIRDADAPDVLVEALRRATELGLLLSSTRLHELLKHWGQQGELAKIEEVLAAMPLGGLPYSHDTAYVVIRTAVNAGEQEKAEYYASAMVQRNVRLTPTTVRLLEGGRERQRQMQQAMQMQMQQQQQQA